MKTRGDVYDLEEIVSDAFSTCIVSNKMHIAFYLYREYKQAVLGNVHLCIDALIYAFKEDYTNKSKITHLEERLFILDKFLPFIDYKRAFELLDCFEKLILEEASSNFIVYTVNPLKIMVILMAVSRDLSDKYPLLKFKADQVTNMLNIAGNLVIRFSLSVQDVQDMVLDRLYNNIEIIDMLAYLNNIPILQNPVLDVIVTNIYYGPYQREFFMSNSI